MKKVNKNIYRSYADLCLRGMDPNYATEVATSLYVLNKEAKVCRDCQDYFELADLYELKDRVLYRLYKTGNLRLLGFHYLYWDRETKQNFCGVLSHIVGAEQFSFHTPIGEKYLDKFRYNYDERPMDYRTIQELEQFQEDKEWIEKHNAENPDDIRELDEEYLEDIEYYSQDIIRAQKTLPELGILPVISSEKRKGNILPTKEEALENLNQFLKGNWKFTYDEDHYYAQFGL